MPVTPKPDPTPRPALSAGSLNAGRRENYSKEILLGMFLVLLVGVAYWPCVYNGFILLDDPGYVAANPHVQTGLTLRNIAWAFSTAQQANWHPLTWMSHMLDCQLFGSQPWGQHLTNVCLHILNTVTLFLLLRGMTGSTWRSVFVAAFFGLHPLRVESVAWISERKDVLSMFFLLTSIWAYWRYARQTANNLELSGTASVKDSRKALGPFRRGRAMYLYGLALSLFVLGLLSKPMVVSLPFVLLLLDYWPLRRHTQVRWSTLWLEKAPFLVLAGVSSATTIIAQKRGQAVLGFVDLPFLARVENAFVSYCRYLGKFFIPARLSLVYPPEHWPLITVLGAVWLLGGISTFAWLNRRQHPYLWVGWCWFIGTLVPAIGLIQVGLQSMADRYTYLPSIGLLLALVWGVHQLWVSMRLNQTHLVTAGAVLLSLCMVATWQNGKNWKNSETLFRHALTVNPGNFAAHNFLALVLWDQGKTNEARAHFEETLRLKPRFVQVQAVTKGEVGSMVAGEIVPRNRPRDTLGASLTPRTASDTTNAVSRSDKSPNDEIQQLRQAVSANPRDYLSCNDLGGLLLNVGDLEGAIAMFQQALSVKPDLATAHNNLGIALFTKGDQAQGTAHFQEAIKLQPDYARARYNLALALEGQGRRAESIAQLRESLRLEPDYPPAQRKLKALLGP